MSGNACRDVDLEISACPDRLDARQRRTLGDLPSPLWGGVGGGGSSWRTHLMKQLLPPSPPLPQRKSGLPDLRKIKPRPGQARGAWGGSRPRLPHELIPFQRDTARRKFKAVPSPSGEFFARDGSSIIRGYRNGRAIPSGENLHRISKEIQDGLEPGFRLVISSAAKPLRHRHSPKAWRQTNPAPRNPGRRPIGAKRRACPGRCAAWSEAE
jgi:hypothetical protein